MANYISDYQFDEAGRFKILPERLKFWTEYFLRIPEDQKETVATELIAWVIKCRRIVEQVHVKGLAEGRPAIQSATENTMQIAVALIVGAEPELLLRDFGNVIVESGGASVIVKDGRVIEAGNLMEISNLQVLSAESALDRIETTATFNLQQMQETIVQARKEATNFFRLVQVFASLGFLIIVTGVVAMFVEYATSGMVTAAAGVILEALAALFLNKDRELKANVAEYDLRIRKSENSLAAVNVTNTIDDPNSRNSMKEKIVEPILAQIK